jgi:hypothetical protein
LISQPRESKKKVREEGDCEEQINGRITKIHGGTLMIEMLGPRLECVQFDAGGESTRKEQTPVWKRFVSRKKEIRKSRGDVKLFKLFWK